jgi:hypothetical protein
MTYTKPEVRTLGEATEVILGVKGKQPVMEPPNPLSHYKTLSYDLDE